MKLQTKQLAPLLWHHPEEVPYDWSRVYPHSGQLTVEIGCGQGEYLYNQAHRYPDQNFLGLEILWKRVGKTLNRIAPKNQGLLCPNVRLVCCDAWIVFERLIGPRTVDHFVSLFPCPWPKKKHIKNRLFSKPFLQLLNSRLKTDGSFVLVTDAQYFYDWVVEESEGTGFSLSKETIDPQYATKFEKKWLNQGQKKFFKVEFRKTQHIDVPLKEKETMKSFRLDAFNADDFAFEDYKDDVVVVFKNLLFDAKRQVANVHVIVQEAHLTQHIRVEIYKKEDYWRICMAEGQDYYPTSGVNKAIELIYQAAL